jgi:8-oxo-dGTP pyrophosphatase MutT (NUDIX family)
MSLPDFFNDFEKWRRMLQALPYDRLPGVDAQLKMAPEIRHADVRSLGQGRGATQSSVLFLFYPAGDGTPTTVFIQRPTYKGAHSGQISFPGGRYEEGDASLQYTALRETYEEIGVHPDQVEVAGRLTDLFIPPSNYIVSPFLGVTAQRPEFVPDPNEVVKVLEIPVKAFFQEAFCVHKTIHLSDGFSVKTPCFSINGHIIWGATAMMISEFVEMVKQV